MRAVVTRVTEASVTINEKVNKRIKGGYLVLLGVHKDDEKNDAVKLAEKICNLRIFEDDAGKMNLDLAAVCGEILVVSQFTLFADTKSRRPGFTEAARPDKAVPLYELFIETCRDRGFSVEQGEFGADMKVYSLNNGPVTIIFDTKEA